MLVARPRAVENIGSGIVRGFPEAALNAPCPDYQTARTRSPVSAAPPGDFL